MVVRMNDGVVTFFAAEDFDSAVSDYFVSGHVCSSTCATLYWVAEELIVKFAFYDFVASLADSIFDFFIQFANHVVADSASFFDFSHRIDEFWLHFLAGDLEVFGASHGLYAIVSFYWYFFGADGVGFNTVCHNAQPHFVNL